MKGAAVSPALQASAHEAHASGVPRLAKLGQPSSADEQLAASPDSCRSPGGAALLWHHEVPVLMRELYIFSGYRSPGSAALCIKSLVLPTNETYNAWTHFAPFLVFTWQTALLATSSMDAGHYWILLSLYASICTYLGVSTFAHLFSHYSLAMRHFAFRVDYCGITVYAAGASLAHVYYVRPLGPGVPAALTTPSLFLPTVFLLACAACTVTCASRHWGMLRYVVRTAVFAALWGVVMLPVFYRMWHAPHEDMALWWWHIAFEVLAGAVNAAKLPERWAPGKFDVLGHRCGCVGWGCVPVGAAGLTRARHRLLRSHQIFHVLVAVATYLQVAAIQRDAARLEEHPDASPAMVALMYLGVIVCAALNLLWHETRPGGVWARLNGGTKQE